MLSKEMVDLDAIATELMSRGIHFHNDRIKSLRRYMGKSEKRIQDLEENVKKLTDKVMLKQREILVMHNHIIELQNELAARTVKACTR